MGNYTIFLKFENPRRGRQARNVSENDPKILDLKSSSEQIIFRKLSLGAPVFCRTIIQCVAQIENLPPHHHGQQCVSNIALINI